MNMFVPQSVQTQVELSHIAAVKNQIMSPMNARPVIKLKQDTLIGAYQMTEKRIKMDWKEAMNMAMYTYESDYYKIKKGEVDTFNMYSVIIPDNINYKDGKVKISNGDLLEGTMSGKILTDQIVMIAWDRYDPYTTKVFIDNTQRLATFWLMNYGFTVGLRDATPTKEIEEFSKKLIREKEIEVEHLITEIENNPEMLDADLFEEDIKNKLNRRVDIGKKSMDMLSSKNHFYTMVDSGAKGDAGTNIGPIMGALAQDLLRQERIPKQVNGRTLHHFFQNDDRPTSRGYIKSSYYDGLQPHEFWFHHMTGREGLISTAIKTAETGYQQRKLIKGLEDIKVMYDGTVRTGNNMMLQIIFGGNNFELSKQKYVKLNVLSMGDSQIREKYGELAEEMIEMRDKMREIQTKVKGDFVTIVDTYLQPANYVRIIEDGKTYSNNKESEKLTGEYVMAKLNDLLSHEKTPLLTMSTTEKYPLKSQDEKRFKFLFKLALYEYLAPKRCITEYKFDKSKFDFVIKQILKSYNETMVNYGEMVGILTAQSVGEPLTQQTLSSFHKTGAGGLQGGPRFRELLSYTKNIATPYTYIYLKKEFRENKVIAQKIASHLKYTVMKDIARKITIVYDSDVENAKSYTVKDGIDKKTVFYINNDRETTLETMPWLFRISLSKEAMIENDINMLDIKSEFIKFWNDNYGDMMGVKKQVKDLISKVMRGCIATNFNNSDEPTIHVRFELNQIDNQMLMDLYDIILNKFKMKGSENITRIDEIKSNNLITFDGADREMKTGKELVIYANGIDMNMLKHIPAIDMTRTFCNSLSIILKNYGIEAARAFLIREIPLQFDKPIIPQHPQIIADLMTSTGTITSIDRHGMNRMDKDPLAKASFEKMVEHFVNAAVFSETDTLQSVSSQIMVGKAFTGGTGMCEIIMDNEMLENTSNADYISATSMSGTGFQLSTSSLIDDIMKMKEVNIYMPS